MIQPLIRHGHRVPFEVSEYGASVAKRLTGRGMFSTPPPHDPNTWARLYNINFTGYSRVKNGSRLFFTATDRNNAATGYIKITDQRSKIILL